MQPNTPLETANQAWGTAQLVNSSGNPISSQAILATDAMPNPGYSGGSGGGTDAMIDIAGLKKNVGFLNWATGALFVGGLSAFLILDGRISDKILTVARDVTEIKVEQARQAATLVAINGTLEKIDKKVDENDSAALAKPSPPKRKD